MPLNLSRLENIQVRGDKRTARCPACAESGHDSTGEHLVIYADGRFGCVVAPGDVEHRRVIWKLAGGETDSKQPVRPVRDSVYRGCRGVGTVFSGRVGRVFSISPAKRVEFVSVCEGVPLNPSDPSESSFSAPGALVPLDTPFIEGKRYREAGATDLNRLDLYVADESGPWIRKHGVLIACNR